MHKTLHCHLGKQGELIQVIGGFSGSICRSANDYFEESFGISLLIIFLEKMLRIRKSGAH